VKENVDPLPTSLSMTTHAESRRRFMSAATATAVMGFPAIASAQAPVKFRVQTSWPPKTAGYTAFQRFCANVKKLSEGKVEFLPFPEAGIVATFEMFDAVKSGVLDAMH
jgi:TRAP-type mannitol/chloroaromatic compound transport system substrate-binding protein